MTYFQANEDALKIVTGNFWTRLVQERFSVTTKRRALIATDLAVLVLALLATRVVIDLVLGSDIVSTTASAHLSTSILGLLWLLSIRVAGAYSPRHLRAGAEEYKRVLRASFVTAGLFGAAFFIFGISYSRAQFLAWVALGTSFLCLSRLIRRRLLHQMHRRGLLMTPVLVAGSSHSIDSIARVFVRERWLGYQVLGAVTPDGEQATPFRLPVLGRLDDIADIINTNDIEVVIFAEGTFNSAKEFRRIGWKLEESRVQMIVVPTLADISSQRLEFRPVAGLPFVDVAKPRALDSLRWVKRATDLIGSSLILLLLSPVFLLVALLVRLEDGGPVLFRQERVGLRGEVFKCLKFRSMCVDAEAKLAQLKPRNEGAGVLFKMCSDPRVTRIGGFIRRFSLDELPQLVNVLRGDMSLVGPRPALPSEVQLYDSDTRRRLEVRPGLTGLWQVSGRSALPWEETVRLDLYYVDNWSLVQDLIILFRTVRAVVSSDGAY